MTIRAPSGTPGLDWVTQADQFLRHMHQGLAFAHGARLQTPRLDYLEGDTFTATFYAGLGYRQEFAVQHFLNHDPIIAALVTRFFERGPVSEVVWIALRWMQSGTTVDEVRFLTAMTALETIIESELPEKKGTIIPKANFKILRQKLMEVVDQHPDLTSVQRDPTTTTAALVKLRNTIVHTGVLPEDIDIWDSIILVRELIARIVLSEIGFKGRYCCYIGGQHDREFPELFSPT